MKTLITLICLLFVLTANAQSEDVKGKDSKQKSIGSQTATREKIKAFKAKNQKTVNALEEIEDEGADEGDEEEEE